MVERMTAQEYLDAWKTPKSRVETARLRLFTKTAEEPRCWRCGELYTLTFRSTDGNRMSGEHACRGAKVEGWGSFGAKDQQRDDEFKVALYDYLQSQRLDPRVEKLLAYMDALP